MEIDFDFACRDDCLDQMVPSDLRVLVGQRDKALEQVAMLESRLSSATQECAQLRREALEAGQYAGQLSAELAAVKAQVPRWIPVREDLPPLDTAVLVHRVGGQNNHDDVQYGWRSHKYGTRDDWEWRQVGSPLYDYVGISCDGSEIVRWMPLPPKQPAPAAMEKQTVMVGTIGHVDSGKTSLSAAIARTLDSTAIPGTTKESP